MYIETHNGSTIHLLMPQGVFVADIGDSEEIQEAALPALRQRLDALRETQRIHTRTQLDPVAVWIVHPHPKHSSDTLLTLARVQGIVANVQYHAVLRTDVGHIALKYRTLIALHPDDARVNSVRDACRELTQLHQQCLAKEQAFFVLLKTLPTVDIPTTKTKEDALEEEPKLLAALRDIMPNT